MTAPDARTAALHRLAPLLGEWSIEAVFPGAPPTGPAGRQVFERALDEQFVVGRTSVPHPDAPDALWIIDAHADAYTSHYFDSRGVVRVYAMTFDDGLWTLSRTTPDFSPLPFSQRFRGVLSDDGRSIHGAWELSDDGTSWRHDFDLAYTKLG